MYIDYPLIFSCALGIIFFTGQCANMLVISLFAKHSSQKKKHLDMLVLSMSVADFLTLFLIPFLLVSTIQSTWSLGDIFCKIFHFFLAFSLAASIYSLCAVSITRAQIILRPFRSPARAFMVLILALVWALSFLSSLPLRIHATTEIKIMLNTTLCLPALYQEHYQIVLIQFILYYLIPLLVITFNYIRLLLALQKSPMMSLASFRNTRKASVMIFCAIITFSVCWLPVYFLELCIYLGIYRHNYAWDTFYFICNILQYVHPCVNPVLYVFVSKRYRNGKTKLFLCCTDLKVHPQLHCSTKISCPVSAVSS